MTRTGKLGGGNPGNRFTRSHAAQSSRLTTEEAYEAAPRAPTMARSRIQLGSTYAPGVLFTWEGAKGICRSVPLENPAKNVNDATRLLIFDGIKEYCSNWYARASQTRGSDPVPIQLILDDAFHNIRTEEVSVDQSQFQLTEPSKMGYVPYPLLYRCGVCGHLREYGSIHEQANNPLPRKCGDHEARWTQVDVVYVHWSGHLEPLSPFTNNLDRDNGTVSPINRCQCGGQQFRLNNNSPIFSDWYFTCEDCQRRRKLKQQDPLTWEVLDRQHLRGGRKYEFIEVDMLPVSYRANSAFYPQRISFIEFRDRSVVELLLPEREDDLILRLAQIHGFQYSTPSDEEIQAALQLKGRADDWADYCETLNLAKNSQKRGFTIKAEALRQDAAALKDKWYADEIISRGRVQSGELLAAVKQRLKWARKYDPIRLTIEHDRFVSEHVEERRERHEAIDVMDPDRLICDAIGDPAALDRYRREIGELLSNIGIERLTLIRGLPICEASFGFSRVSSTPVYERHFNSRTVDMPVRLGAFPVMPNSQHPIYVTQQRNEALYFNIDKDRVHRWLVANGISNVSSDGSLGATYLETYTDFGPFVQRFKQREGRGQSSRDLSSYVYLLLHSLAHQAMHSLADVSGLDRDALGEYIFPADCSFVIYRKGMTPDLGNVSAMWRNHGADFLRRMLDARQLRCGSGSLCDTRGGACPACIMIAEVSCLASNQLLSRATLRGGPAPNWEPSSAPALIGFFDRAVK